MSGDPNATGAAGFTPLPPAYSQRPVRAPEPGAGEQLPRPPFFGPNSAIESSPGTSAPEQITPSDESAATAFPFEEQSEPAMETQLPFERSPEPAFESPLPYEDRPEPAFDEPLPFEAPAPASVPEYPPLAAFQAEPTFAPDSLSWQAAEEQQPGARVGTHAMPPPTSEAEALVAGRLEDFARRLRERGSDGLAESFSGDPLDLALASLVSGYLAGRGG